MAGKPQFTELCSNLIHSDEKHNYYLRITEYRDRDGQVVRKFGISEFWFCDTQRRWFPSSKHHVFLPLSIWPKLIGLSHVINDFSLNGPLENDGSARGNASSSRSPIIQQSGGRRRGRPPKCADGHGNVVDASKASNGKGNKRANSNGSASEHVQSVEAGTSSPNADCDTEWLHEGSSKRGIQTNDHESEEGSEAKIRCTEEDNAARDGCVNDGADGASGAEPSTTL
jgi:hypothetical protein